MDRTQPPKPPKKTALETLNECIQRDLAPFRQIQKEQDLFRRLSTQYPARDLLNEFDPQRKLQEMFEHVAIPKRVQEMLDVTSIAVHAQRMLEQYIPQNPLAQHKVVQQLATGFDSAGETVKVYEKYLSLVTPQKTWLEKLQSQALGGFAVRNFATQLERANPVFAEMEAAKNSFDTLLESFQDIDFSTYGAIKESTNGADAAAQFIAKAASGEPTLKEAVDKIITAIQAQQDPTVQLTLFLFFRKLLDWLIAGSIGAVISHYAPLVLGESPQAATKAVKANALTAVGIPALLVEYRYVTSKVVIVRQNPRALSPEMGRLTFGKTVKLVKKDKDFALVLWIDKESGAEIQGWVFSRYLSKFN